MIIINLKKKLQRMHGLLQRHNDSTKLRLQKTAESLRILQIHEKFGKYKKWMEKTTKLGKL